MTRNEAEKFANGFTQAAQLFGGIETVRAFGKTESLGWLDFVQAYGARQQAFNDQTCWFMPNCHSAWLEWQESNGKILSR